MAAEIDSITICGLQICDLEQLLIKIEKKKEQAVANLNTPYLLAIIILLFVFASRTATCGKYLDQYI